MAAFQNAQKAYAVTPSDTVLFPQGVCEALWIGVAGTIAVIPSDPALGPPGPPVNTTVGVGLFRSRRCGVNATGTSASQIVALY